MAAPIVMSDEDLFALTGDWNAAAALRDQQNRALNEYLWSQPAPTPSNVLSGNILAGASWHGLNTTLADELLKETGQATTNVAVNGSTTGETLNQLNTFLANGGAFDPNATVYLQTGGVDFLLGYDKGVIKDNINQIVKTLGDQGVDVVLTGSPYAKSLQDVIDNKFDPKLDPLFNEIAKENKNVALVGVQGEILQNKNLVIDAVHTNAEGTAIYNQAVIDALSQFKNQVPSSTPETIAQIQQTNTVSTAPPVITQAAASPVVAQSLANTVATTSRAIPTARGTVIEGDDIEEQIAGVPQVVYETRVDPNNKANWETYNPKTGEIIDSGTFAGGGDQGLLRAAAPVIGLAASTVGLPFITNLLSGATGLTGSALAGATGATIGAGTQAVTGGSAEDIARAALLGGGGAYLGSQLNDYIASMDVPVDFTNMTPEQIADATETNFINDLKRAGLSNAQINDFMNNAGGVTTAVTTPTAVSTPVTDGGTVAVTAPNTSLSNVLSTIASTTPAVTVTAPKSTQVDQATLNLINSQLATNVSTPANLANVEVTSNRPATTQEVVNAITATLPNVTSTQAQNIAQQVITSNKPITTQEVINAITATLPALTTPVTTSTVPSQTITAQKPVTTQDIVNAIVATTPAVTSSVPTQTITSQKPSSITDAVTAATIPLIQPSTPLTPTQVTAQQELSNSEKIRLAQLGLTAAGLLGAGSALSNNGSTTGFDVVPVPESWKNPPAPSVAPYRPLSPINFGNRNLLIGTQWEKFLDPNYGKVPEPVQYSQPSNLSYNDLMGILGSKQGMPPASSLSINDIISGIQNQYGQANRSSMG